MSKRIMGVSVAVVLGLALALMAPKAQAQGLLAPTGPIVFKNQSGVPLTIEGVSYMNGLGQEVALPVAWDVRAGFFGYLRVNGAKVPARQFKCRIRTAEGTTFWTCNLRGLDADGDFVVLFSADNYRAHLATAR